MTLGRLWAGWRTEYVTAAAASASAPTEGSAPEGRPASEERPGAALAPVQASTLVATPAPDERPGDSCVFCRMLASPDPDTVTHVLWRDSNGLAAALLNAYPYTTGHLMVMPRRHVGELEELTPEEAVAVWSGLSDAVRAIKTAYIPDGLNVGANLGRAAGAGVPGHFHIHALPRWNGDTNFMTTVADTRVLPEALSVTDEKLRAAWPAPSTTSPPSAARPR